MSDDLRVLLERLEIPIDPATVLGVWPGQPDGGVEVHLSPAAFWRVIQRRHLPVTSTERRDLVLPHCHRFSCDRVDFITFTAAHVLRPGTVTPGFALRLT